MKNKVCILTTGHSVLDDRIFYKEAWSLHRAGFEVTLIAPLNEDGFLTDMGRNPIAHEETIIDRIRIIGFRIGRSSILCLHKARTVSQWIRLYSVGRLRFGQDPFSDIIKKGIQADSDVYHCHEVWSLYAGIQIKRELQKRGKNPKLICDVHEFWPAKRSSKGIRETLRSNAIACFEKKALKYVDYFITVNQIIRGYLLILSNFTKTEVLYNCPVLSISHEPERRASQEIITICHEGALRFDRGLKEMLQVMKILKQRHNGMVRFLIIGDAFGEERRYLERKTKEYGIEDVMGSTGWLAYEGIGGVLSLCSIGIIFMDPKISENIMFASPNKLFNYMRYGLPIVTVDLPEIRRIVLESRCGIVVKERTVEALADALSMLIDDADLRSQLGNNGLKAVMEKYHWGIMEAKLLRIYRELISCQEYIL